MKRSIQEQGLFLPIIVNGDGYILDGHNRYVICKELGIEPKIEVKTFTDLLEEKAFVVKVNLERRQLNDYERAELGRILLEIEKEKAKQRQQTTQFGHGGVHLNTTEQGKARDIVANQVGLSPTTFQRAVTIIEKAPEELKQKVRNGQTSITYAYNSIKNRELQKNLPELPEGKFDVILADPPWKYDLALRGDPTMHYSVLSCEEISNKTIPSNEDAVLFLWTTNPKVEEALQVMKAWGFSYKTNMVWVKDNFGTGYYFRGQHELLLLGVKGSIGVPTEENRPSSVLTAPREEHSKKPDLVYELIEKMYPNHKYLELFARKKRDGWTSWGNELE